MKKLTTEIKDRVLVFFGKGHKVISSKQEMAFLEESNTSARGITIDGDFVNFSSVAKIISLNEFYNENPDLRPSRSGTMNNYTYSSKEHLGIRRYDKYSTRPLELMREGLFGHIQRSTWKGTGKRPAQEILETMDRRITELKKEADKQRLFTNA